MKILTRKNFLLTTSLSFLNIVFQKNLSWSSNKSYYNLELLINQNKNLIYKYTTYQLTHSIYSPDKKRLYLDYTNSDHHKIQIYITKKISYQKPYLEGSIYNIFYTKYTSLHTEKARYLAHLLLFLIENKDVSLKFDLV